MIFGRVNLNALAECGCCRNGLSPWRHAGLAVPAISTACPWFLHSMLQNRDLLLRGMNVCAQNPHCRCGSTRGLFLARIAFLHASEHVRRFCVSNNSTPQLLQVRMARIPRAWLFNRVEHDRLHASVVVPRRAFFATSYAGLRIGALQYPQEHVTHSDGRRRDPTPLDIEAMVSRSFNHVSSGSSYSV